MNLILICSDCGESFKEVEAMVENHVSTSLDCIECPVCGSICFHVSSTEKYDRDLVSEIKG